MMAKPWGSNVVAATSTCSVALSRHTFLQRLLPCARQVSAQLSLEADRHKTANCLRIQVRELVEINQRKKTLPEPRRPLGLDIRS